MDAKNILLIGIKRSVVAFEKTTGQQLWSTPLAGAFGDSFVSILADDQRVYAHTKGELFCLDLLSGQVLWKNPLKGMGYGLACMAIPGGSSSSIPTVMQKKQQDESSNNAAGSS